jgi:hypothetical protein
MPGKRKSRAMSIEIYFCTTFFYQFKVLCDVISPQTTFTTGNIRAGRGYFVKRKKN